MSDARRGSSLPKVELIRPVLEERPFDDPEWLFEIKHDGFRAALYFDSGEVRLVSRNGHVFQRFAGLRRWLERRLALESAILDAEIVCLDDSGRSVFADLMAGRSTPYVYAFDLLWSEGRDLRGLPLEERKERLRSLVPDGDSFLLFVDHLVGTGRAFFDQACRMDLEGMVAKSRRAAYRTKTRWVKVKNPNYSQLEGRSELFRRPGS